MLQQSAIVSVKNSFKNLNICAIFLTNRYRRFWNTSRQSFDLAEEEKHRSEFRYGYMIDNIVLLIAGTLNQRPIGDLIPRCHPLGIFEQMGAVAVADTIEQLYNAVLVDTPLGKAQFDRSDIQRV